MTPAWCQAVKPEDKPVDYRDTARPGLVLRVETSGRKTWVCRYWFNGRDRRYTIGTFWEPGADRETVTLAEARAAAREKLGEADLGTDPQAEVERQRIGQRIEQAVETWEADSKQGPAARWKGGLVGGAARSFMPHVRRFKRELGSRLVVEVTARDIEQFVSAPVAAATRNRALTIVRAFFAWARRKGLTDADADPTSELPKEREAARSRVLTDDELRALIHGFDSTRYGRAVRLLALTGLRRDEVLGACWSWLDRDAGVMTIPPEAEKTGRSRWEPRVVALSVKATELLAAQRQALFAEGVRSEWIFATNTGERPHRDALKPTLYGLRGLRSNGQPASTNKRAKMRPAVLAADVTIHDVRRTVADALLNRLGVAPWIVDHVVLGHARPKLLRTYMPTLPMAEARAALERWGDELARILGEAPASGAGGGA